MSFLLVKRLLGIILLIGLECLLIFLGFWQINRAAFKEKILVEMNLGRKAQTKTVQSVAALSKLPNYNPVKLIGYYDNEHTILLDNKVHQGKAGFWVYTPFFIAQNNTAILVNRGWRAFKNAKRDLPIILPILDEQVIDGYVAKYPGIGLRMGKVAVEQNSWPLLVNYVDSSFFEERLGYQISEKTVLLKPEPSSQFVRDWYAVEISPDRHYAYATQWFTMAITLFILTIWYVIKASKKTS